MPNLQHLPDFERHLTLAALAHCPRDYWYTDQVRRGLMPDLPASDSLTLGILVHYGLEALWIQRRHATGPWLPSPALDAIDNAPETATISQALKDEARKGVLDYAAQWVGARDHWKPLSVSPVSDPPAPWCVLDKEFVAYPDLTVEAGPMYPVITVDHKTSAWKFEANRWEWEPQLLTQCLAAKQLKPDASIFYMIDYLQRPGKRSNVWSFPATPIWEFTAAKEAAAWEWLRHLFERRNHYRSTQFEGRLDLGGASITQYELPWPQELSQCQTAWGLCKWYSTCFGGDNGPTAT